MNERSFILGRDGEPVGTFGDLEEAQQEGCRIAVGLAALQMGLDGENDYIPVPPPWFQDSEDQWTLYAQDGTELTIHYR